MTRDDFWKSCTRFWMHLFCTLLPFALAGALLFGFSVAWNWCGLWQTVPDIFGGPALIWEGLTFVLEIFFVLMATLGWKVLSRSTHLVYTWLAGFGLLLVLWFPVAVNAWMESPVCQVIYNGNLTLSFHGYWWYIFCAPLAVAKVLHLFFVGGVIGATLTAAVCCTYILKNNYQRMAIGSLWISLVVSVLGLILAFCLGDNSGYNVARDQHMKMAAVQGLQNGGREVPFNLAGPLKVPKMLSRLATRNNRGFVPGINDVLNGGYEFTPVFPDSKQTEKVLSFEVRKKLANRYRYVVEHKEQYKWRRSDPAEQRKVDKENGLTLSHLGYSAIENRAELIPRVPLLFGAFRFMIGGGLLLFILMGLLVYNQLKDKDKKSHWISRVGQLFLYPLALLCSAAGWIVAEAGRMPWTILHLLPSKFAVSLIPLDKVRLEVIFLASVCLALLVLACWCVATIIKKGLQTTEQMPKDSEKIRSAVEE